MKRILSRLAGVVGALALAIVLLVVAMLIALYSTWGQERLRRVAVAYLNKQPGTEVRLDTLSVRFPLKAKVGGFMMAVDGDTLIKARRLVVDVALTPLLSGRIDINEAVLDDGFYRMGTPDSAMYMRISAGHLALRPALVTLSPLDISLDDAIIRDGRVDMVLNNDTTPSDTAKSATDLRIHICRLKVENLTYTLSMMPTIDSIGVNISNGLISVGNIDVGAQTVKISKFYGGDTDIAYIAPNAQQIAAYPATAAAPADTTASEPWTINIDTLDISGQHALYTTRGVVPQPGLDFSYIELAPFLVDARRFCNQGPQLSVWINLSATERCGVNLDFCGDLSLTPGTLALDKANLMTGNSGIDFSFEMGMGDLVSDPTLPLSLMLDGDLSTIDLAKMFPGYTPYLKLIGPKIRVDADINGTSGRIGIANLDISLLDPKTYTNNASLSARGTIDRPFTPDMIGGDIALTGNIVNIKSIVDGIVDPKMGISIPPMTLNGNISYHPGLTKGDLTATTLGGRIAMKGLYNARSEGYDLSLTTVDFPVNAFCPSLALGRATLDVKASGHGFDLFSHSTAMDVAADVVSLVYDGYDYRNITLNAGIADGTADIKARADMPDISADIDARGNLRGNTYDWTARIDGDHIDLYALKLMTEPTTVSLSIEGSASLTSDLSEISASVRLADLDYDSELTKINLSDVNATILAVDTLTSVQIHNRDLVASASTPMGYRTIGERFGHIVDVAMAQIKERRINVDSLQRAVPMFNLDLVCGGDNMLTDILATRDMSLSHLSLSASNDTTLNLDSHLLGFTTGSTRLDTISVSLVQQGEKMRLIGNIDNRPGTLDNIAHVTLDGLVNTDRLSVRVIQQNLAGETGFDIGAITAFADSSVNARIFPLTPTIGYKKWTLNLDNSVYYNFYTHRVKANLKMRGDQSVIELLTAQSDTVGAPMNDILLKIGDIHLADWISFNPFAPPIQGNLSANMHVKWNGGTDINGTGNLSLSDFYYDKRRVSDIDVDLGVQTNIGGTIRANADINLDGKHTMSIAGALNDSISGSPFNLDFSLIHFPLSSANPFLPVDVAQLSGTLNGKMIISGDADRPVLDGEITFTDASIKAAITNTSYSLSDVKIPVDSNVVRFSDFSIMGANKNPLYVNGTVDITELTSPRINLDLKARNMMLVNTNKAAKNAQVFGKAFIDLDAGVRGNMRYLDVNADLTILAGTNVTYVLSFDDTGMSTLSNDGIVKFVNLNDTSQVAAADTIADSSMLLNIDAQLNIESGTNIVVDLPTGSRDKVQVMPQGNLTYTQAPASDGRMTGRININSGFARYTLPVIGAEKSFTFNAGSYVAFNGDLLNPTLNLHATDVIKSNVTVEGQNSRLVNFDVLLGVTGTLEQMDVKFDLSTNDDITVANELQSMSAEQRANQAMNLLLYNVYSGPGTSASMSANPLFSFLESQINNWAAENIKGVDLQFGIDQYNRKVNGSSSSTMNYSYQVSKSLFNDRFKIVVGGSYSTDTNADENIAENLINDISFEYFLNQQQTMFVKLFRHMGYESILEGEIVQTGVGFVYKRRLDSMANFLPKFMRPHHNK